MNEYDRTPRYKPTEPPAKPHQGRTAELTKPYAAVWINSVGRPVVLGMCRFRKGAERIIRYKHMNDDATPSENHHTRYYIWDSSLPWNPDVLGCWTPIADEPRDQWTPTL